MFEAAGAGDPGPALCHARLAAGVPGDQVRAAGTHSQGLLPRHQDRPGLYSAVQHNSTVQYSTTV